MNLWVLCSMQVTIAIIAAPCRIILPGSHNSRNNYKGDCRAFIHAVSSSNIHPVPSLCSKPDRISEPAVPIQRMPSETGIYPLYDIWRLQTFILIHNHSPSLGSGTSPQEYAGNTLTLFLGDLSSLQDIIIYALQTTAGCWMISRKAN